MATSANIIEHRLESGILSDFISADDFTMAFAIVNSMNIMGEEYDSILSSECKEALKFLNSYSSKIHIYREDVLSLLEELGLSHEIAIEVVDKVIDLSRQYRQQIDYYIQSLSVCHLVDFNWCLKIILCDGHAIKQHVLIVQLSLVVMDQSNQRSTILLELDQTQLQKLMMMFESIDHTLGQLNINL